MSTITLTENTTKMKNFILKSSDKFRSKVNEKIIHLPIVLKQGSDKMLELIQIYPAFMDNYKELSLDVGDEVIVIRSGNFYYGNADEMKSMYGTSQILQTLEEDGRITFEKNKHTSGHASSYNYHIKDVSIIKK